MTEAPGSTARTGISFGVIGVLGGIGVALGVLGVLVLVVVFYGPVANRNMPAIQQRQDQQYEKINKQLCDQERAQIQQDGGDPTTLTAEGCPAQ